MGDTCCCLVDWTYCLVRAYIGWKSSSSTCQRLFVLPRQYSCLVTWNVVGGDTRHINSVNGTSVYFGHGTANSTAGTDMDSTRSRSLVQCMEIHRYGPHWWGRLITQIMGFTGRPANCSDNK